MPLPSINGTVDVVVLVLVAADFGMASSLTYVNSTAFDIVFHV